MIGSSNNYEPATSYENIAGQGLSIAEKKIASAEISARYIFINDSSIENREELIYRTFSSIDKNVYFEGDSYFLSSVRRDFDVMIFGGNDISRILGIYQKYRIILKSKFKIIVTCGSSPKKRARAISAGFDDVIDTDRVMPAEAIARIRAMWNRHSQTQRTREALEARHRTLCGIAEYGALTLREKKLLILAMEQRNAVVTYAQIKSLLSNFNEEMSEKNIQVMICQLRKKLREPFEFRSVPGIGYQVNF